MSIPVRRDGVRIEAELDEKLNDLGVGFRAGVDQWFDDVQADVGGCLAEHGFYDGSIARLHGEQERIGRAVVEHGVDVGIVADEIQCVFLVIEMFGDGRVVVCDAEATQADAQRVIERVEKVTVLSAALGTLVAIPTEPIGIALVLEE